MARKEIVANPRCEGNRGECRRLRDNAVEKQRDLFDGRAEYESRERRKVKAAERRQKPERIPAQVLVKRQSLFHCAPLSRKSLVREPRAAPYEFCGISFQQSRRECRAGGRIADAHLSRKEERRSPPLFFGREFHADEKRL